MARQADDGPAAKPVAAKTNSPSAAKPRSPNTANSSNTAKSTMQQLAEQYGYAASFFSQDAELQRLIAEAVKGQWTTNVFQGRFMNTQWYRNHDAAQRQWADLSTRDPKQAEARLREKELEISLQMSQLGHPLDAGSLRWAATRSLADGWTAAQQKSMVAMYANYQPGQSSGTPAALEMQIKGLANDYGMTATDGQLSDWVNGMLTDRYTKDNIQGYLKDMAKSKYAGMSHFLDQGMTVKQVAQPFLNSYANLLEVPADAIDMNDNLIQQALQGTPAAPNQPPQMQSVYEFEKAVRRDSRWSGTKNAVDAATRAGQGVLKDWGLIG